MGEVRTTDDIADDDDDVGVAAVFDSTVAVDGDDEAATASLRSILMDSM